MPNISFSKTFNVDIPSVNLIQGNNIKFRLVLDTPAISNFTASLSQGSAIVSSLAPSTGYSSIFSPFIDATATAATDSTIIFTPEITDFYGSTYQFEPNPADNTIPSSSLYSTYGDVDYPFLLKLFDIFIVYLSDGTFVEYRIVDAIIVSDKLEVTLNKPISNILKNNITYNTFKRMLFLTRVEDETNIILEFKKKSGKTSYGFVIPENIDPAVLKNIDIISKEVQSKLLSNQPIVQVNSIDTINGGDF
jgi:hypothetical protein